MSDRDRAVFQFYNDTTGVRFSLKVRGRDRIAAVEGFLQKWRAPVSESDRQRPDIHFYFVTDDRLEEFSKFMKQLDAKAAKI
ncbi:hypothetical protein [Hyphomicrobium sp.]|uniref:hypothetical protein n=1 Tax=Hyphomicrobium sp. TaxID=82 RepID=UPI001AC197DE|nr:hypothetical protein [Hyphomicrobium sp.]MBN9247362.1 hypothetical protein [Hyphomicrobium sp.]